VVCNPVVNIIDEYGVLLLYPLNVDVGKAKVYENIAERIYRYPVRVVAVDPGDYTLKEIMAELTIEYDKIYGGISVELEIKNVNDTGRKAPRHNYNILERSLYTILFNTTLDIANRLTECTR